MFQNIISSGANKTISLNKGEASADCFIHNLFAFNKYFLLNYSEQKRHPHKLTYIQITLTHIKVYI